MTRRQPNPYRPGFNQAPAELPGRGHIIASIREALDVAALDARTPRPILITGSRGVGKTVLLGEVAADAAETYSWLTVAVEVRPNTHFTGQLVERLTTARNLIDQAEPGRKLAITGAKVRASLLGVGGEVALARRTSHEHPALPLDDALAHACAAASARESGLVVTVDELHLAHQNELADFAATLQQHIPDRWPLVVVGAGLPSMRDPQRSVTYLERGEWHEIGLLNEADTLRALTQPALTAGRPLTDTAAHHLADSSGGYPYAIQVLGHHTWRASSAADQISIEHATAGVAAAEADLAAGLYASRWQDAAPKEREYLTALAQLQTTNSPATGGDVARQLGAPPSSVSYLRDRLIKKGTLFAEGRELRFPVPGMADWITSTNET